MTQPARTGPCEWTLATAYCASWDTVDPAVQAAASDLAKEVLWALSGRRFGLCSTTVRPCRRGEHDAWLRWEPWVTLPYGILATTFCGCGAFGRCACVASACEVSLPGPVHDVTEVLVDGVALPAEAYIVHERRWLVRVDGDCWPWTQNLTLSDDQPGTWAITYRRGVQVPLGGQVAAGQYACEVAKALTNDSSCRLPRRVQSVVRQGVQASFVDPMQLAKDGMTGLPEVDQWLRIQNPHRLPRDSVVWSPDLDRGRRRTS